MRDTRGLPAATEIGRAALAVADAERAAGFYESVVGLRVQDRRDGRVVLGDGGTPLLVLDERPSLPERGERAAGLFHVAFRVPSRAALGAALRRIEDEWELTGASDHGVSEALYLRDPEGNGVEVYRDRPRDDWESTPEGVRIVTEPLDLDGVRAAGDDTGHVPAGTDVGHVHLEVTDLDRAGSFYEATLGFDRRATYDGARFLGAGGYHHHVGVNVWNRRSEPTAGRGLSWFEVVVPDAEDVAAAREQLSAAGHEVTDRGDGTLAVTDPDGIEIRLRTD